MHHAQSTSIDRLAGAHQRYIDGEAAEQDLQEAEEQGIANDPEAVAMATANFTGPEWETMTGLIGKLVSQFQYYGEERAQGVQDVGQEIYDLCQRAIAEQAATNRQRAMRSAA
jgi:hypothetical protein